MIDSFRPLLEWALPAILLLFLALPSFAQSIQLSAEQQQMLNQLPPAQRQQAMDAMRQAQSGQTQTLRQPLRETVETPISPAVGAEPEAAELRAGANSRLVINFNPRESLSVLELEDLRKDPVVAIKKG